MSQQGGKSRQKYPEPILEFFKCFMRTEMDYLVLGSFLLDKKQMPAMKDNDNWKDKLVLD